MGKIDAKTIARRAVSEAIDCGSWKTAAVMLFYIDSANRNTGACYPAETTTARKLRISVFAVRRANKFWVKAKLLSIPRRARSVAGNQWSNAYHIKWHRLIEIAASQHYCAEVRAEAGRYLLSRDVQKSRSA